MNISISTYQVKRGDTLESVAGQLGISVEALKRYHNTYCDLESLIGSDLKGIHEILIPSPEKIAEQLKTKLAKLEEVEDKDPYFGKSINNKTIYFNLLKGKRNKKFSKPSYSYGNLIEATKGLTIVINDIWSAEIILKELKFSGDNYTGKYEVTLWDHFGLDISDVQNPSIKKPYYFVNGFRAWFILQHIKGFKPFLTKINFTQEFKGNLNQSKAIVNPERQQRIETAEKENREKAERMREIMSGPKF